MAERENSRPRAAVYVRESRDEKQKNYDTIETQRKLLEDYAARQNWQVFSVYEDDNVSGTTFQRPGLRRLEQDLQSGCFDIILLKDLSRLGRNNGRTLLFLEFAEEAGIRIVTADGRYDSDSNTELAGLDTWFNERYAADISRKIRASLQYKIQSGEYIGTAPYGYKKTAAGGRLEPEEEKAFYVGKIFELYLAGWGYSRIAGHFNREGVPPPKSSWSSQSVMRILSSPVYIGVTVQGVSRKLSYKSKKTVRLPKDRWVVTPDTHEPIISREIFYRVQEERARRRHGEGNNRGRLSPYKNLVFCGFCGGKMYSKNGGYLCSSYARKGAAGCVRCFVSEREITAILLPRLQAYLGKLKLAEEYLNDTESEAVERLKENCRRRLEFLYRDRLQGLVDTETYLKLAQQEREKLQELCAEQCRSSLTASELIGRFLAEEPASVSEELLREVAVAAVEKCTVK